MTEYELDKIKKSFVRSNAKCPVEVACLLTVYKILQRKRNGHTYIDRMVQNKWKAYLGRNETRGYIFRHESRNMFAKHSSINTKKTSHHPFHSQ